MTLVWKMGRCAIGACVVALTQGATPGAHAVTQDFLNRIELDEDTVLTVLDGLKDVLGDKGLAVLNFLQFMLVYHWLASTVQAYDAKLSL